MGCLGCAERMQVQDVLEGGEDKDAQKKAGVRWWCRRVRCVRAQKKNDFQDVCLNFQDVCGRKRRPQGDRAKK